MVNSFVLDLKTRLQINDLDYFDEELAINYSYDDPSDADPRYYLYYIAYTAVRLLQGPINILLDHGIIIWVAILTRLVHLLIDVSNWPKRNESKDLTTCALSIYLMEQYLKKVGAGQDLSRTLIYVSLFSFVLLTKFRRQKFGPRQKASKFSPVSIISTCAMLFAPILLNEYFIHVDDQQQHCFLRGIIMTLVIKASSQLHSPPISGSQSAGYLSCLAYFLNPATLITGFWHAKNQTDYPDTAVCFSLLKFRHQVYCFLKTLTKACLILIVSTNMSDVLDSVDEANLSKGFQLPLRVYFTALEFRFSHYFSCILTYSLLKLWEEPVQPNKAEMKICDLLKVEWPRSLLEVVTNWNIPMHLWLKDYVFKTIRQSANVTLAIFATYLVSSSMHGFKFHIWAVLLTLGFLTWIEYNLRSKLARRLDACIAARECRYTVDKKCLKGHTKTIYDSYTTNLINLIFRLLAMSHLAYLGYIFVGNTDESSYLDAIELWSELGFFGHLLALATYLISMTI